MTKESGLKIGLYILAVALVGAATMRAGLAEEAHSSTHAAGQSHHRSGTADRVHPIAKFGVPGRQHARRLPDQAAPKFVRRNAIGMPLVEHDMSVGHAEEGHVSPRNFSVPAASAGPAIKSGNLANTEGEVGRPTIQHPIENRLVISAPQHQGKIDGSRLIRPASAPSGLGGPTKVVAGINGTNIRLKHPY
jgi:hypothetical protein